MRGDMSQDRMGEKQNLERGAIEEFSALFNDQLQWGKLEFKEHLKTPYPDLKCELNNSDYIYS